MLVEDNPVHVVMIESLLRKWNLQIAIAQNGYEAIRKMLVGRYDILLMDMQLPELSGSETSKQIRRMNLTIEYVPILAVTILDCEGMKEIIKEGFIDSYVSKPFSSEQLYTAMKKYLG